MSIRLPHLLFALLALAGCSGKNPAEYKPEPSALEFNNKAVTAMQNNELDQAMISVEKAIGADPRFFNAFANKGAILARLGRDKEAIAAFRNAITLNPEFADAYVPLGALYEKQGKTPYAKKHYAIAVQLYLQLLQKEPDNPHHAANLAVALFLKGDRPAALERLNTFLSSHPSDEMLARVKSKIEASDRNGLLPQRSLN